MKNQKRYRLKPDEWSLIDKYRHYKKQKVKDSNVLVIGDLHEPFCLDGYLDFCINTYYHYKCTDVIFIGDIIDNHYSSFHEFNIDAEYSGKQELDLAIEKAKMKAKADLADLVKGEMNKQSKQYAKEIGSSVNKKQVANDFETVTVNEIKATVVKGYEIFEQDVTLTVNGNYRAWVGLRLPLGEFNKLYEYNAEQILNAYKVEDKSKEAYSNLMKEGSNEDRNIQ